MNASLSQIFDVSDEVCLDHWMYTRADQRRTKIADDSIGRPANFRVNRLVKPRHQLAAGGFDVGAAARVDRGLHWRAPRLAKTGQYGRSAPMVTNAWFLLKALKTMEFSAAGDVLFQKILALISLMNLAILVGLS